MLSLKIVYTVDDGLVVSPSDVYDTYFYGIKVKADDGSKMSEESISFMIRAAQEEVEKALDIRMAPVIVEETQDYYRDDYVKWGLISTDLPVKSVESLEGWFGGVKQLTIKKEWTSCKKGNGDLYKNSIRVIPTRAEAQIIMGQGVGIPLMIISQDVHVPDFWRIKYRTGFDKLPTDLVNFIGKMAASNVFVILGDLILGAGITSQSLSIDGLSQSVSTSKSAEAGGYGARVKAYATELAAAWTRLQSYYTNIRSTTL